jgi:hypothetical protein
MLHGKPVSSSGGLAIQRNSAGNAILALPLNLCNLTELSLTVASKHFILISNHLFALYRAVSYNQFWRWLCFVCGTGVLE